MPMPLGMQGGFINVTDGLIARQRQASPNRQSGMINNLAGESGSCRDRDGGPFFSGSPLDVTVAEMRQGVALCEAAKAS